ncbi:MAG: GlpM family protein [Candidatus Woesearchaeota archaeon]
MSTLYLILKFILGGSLLLGITLLANYIHPKWGGILAVAPIITTLSIIFVRYENSLQTTQQLILSAIYFIIPTLIFLIIMYFLLNKINLIYSLLIAYIIWIIVVLIIQKTIY